MKDVFLVFLMLCAFAFRKEGNGRSFTNELGHKYPLLVNYCPSINALAHEDELSKWDIIIVPPDNLQRYHPDWFQRIRKANPKIKILLYVSCMEIPTSAATPGQPWSWLYSGIKSEWWLKDPQGNHVVFWPGAWMLNVSSQCPQVQGNTWATYLVDYLTKQYLSTGLWDGVFLDCCWDGVSHIGKPVDANNDKLSDNPKQLDSWWAEGMAFMIQRLRKRNPNIIIVGNGDGMYPELNGLMSECFPKGGSFEFIESILKKGKAPHIAILNVCGSQNDLKKMKFGLATAFMLDNCYFSYDGGEYHHGEAWWYDEYNIDLGKPKGKYHIIKSGSTAPSYFDDFSAGFGNWKPNTSAAILSGGGVKGFNKQARREWTNFMDSKFFLLPNTEYTVSFNYCIVETATKFYCEVIRFEGGNKYWLKVENFYTGAGSVKMNFTTDDHEWFISFGIQGTGTVIIDNIRIEPETGQVLKRDFENGIVIVNTSWRPESIRVGGKTIYLQGKEGIILK